MDHSLDQPFATTAIRAHIKPVNSLDLLEQRWRALESESNCSFFVSWSWMGAWIQQNHIACNLELFECYVDGSLVALGIIDSGKIARHHVVQSTTVTLNEAVDVELNMFIEYNGLLTRKGFEHSAWSEFLRLLCKSRYDWDEIRLTNIAADLVDEDEAKKSGLHLAVECINTAWTAALNDDTVDTIINRLGKNKRWQLRRSLKEYQKEGELFIDAATTTQQAQEYFQAMGILHSQRWQRVGEAGSFARTSWVEFHTRLIESTFDRGEIQLLRVRCGDRPIGFIYNFLWRGAVLVLQTGFTTETRNTLRPGYISHLLAMQLNAKLGFRQYDFMIGDSEYKSTLARAESPQMTVRLQRNRTKFRVERALQTIVKTVRRLAQSALLFITIFIVLPEL